jgi:hypothetical protein
MSTPSRERLGEPHVPWPASSLATATTRTGEQTVTDKDVEQTDERGYDTGPWWAELGTLGAVAMIIVGGLAAAWVFLRLPGAPENLATGYYQAAKVVAIGLVIAGSALLGRRRARAAATEETNEPERA